MKHPIRWIALFAMLLLCCIASATAAPRDSRAAAPVTPLVDAVAGPATNASVVRNVAYGPDPLQQFDVYLPAHARRAPVIVMVHGGGWRRGDKAMRSVVQNKVARWVPRGFIVVSVNYRLLPQASVQQQVGDIARAVAVVQAHAAGWGGDRHRFILMGHSAGAQLVALLTTEPGLALARGASSWLGTVSLDSGALDVPAIMRAPHLRLYDRAFGDDPAYWAQVSPFQQMHTAIAPTLLVCSTHRRDSCPQSRQFAGKAHGFGSRAELAPEDLSHRQIDDELGQDSDYTRRVEQFMGSLDPAVARLLAGPGAHAADLPVVTSR